MSSASCRLCGGDAREEFRRQILGKYDIAYLECKDCASLEAQEPFWLDEAYAEDVADTDRSNNLADLDTGAAQRNLNTAAATLLTAKMLGLNNVVDFGGGDGLLCRLLRDHGLNAYVSDLYAMATYARGFTQPDFERPDLVTAFEVFEHFAHPAQDVLQIFSSQPSAVLISTEVYQRQGRDWWYLIPETGQHVFFYSERGMTLLGERAGYDVLRAGTFTLFFKPQFAGWKVKVLRQLLRARPLRLMRTAMAYRHTPGVMQDFGMLQHRREARDVGNVC